MPTVAAIFTAQTPVELVKQLFGELLPDCRVISIMDDSISVDAARAGGVTPAIARRLIRYYLAAEETGAHLIFNTCSTIGDIAIMARTFVKIPIVKIDDSMVAEALSIGTRVGVVGTVATTLAPTS